VLEHVNRQVVVLGDAVERADEGDDRQPEPEAEEREPIPPGEIGSAATAEAERALCEQERGDRR